MRDTCFRAWDKEAKKMFFSGGTPTMLSGFFKQQARGICMEYTIIMQYTGLKDKNDKKIYEGDILKDNKNDVIGFVIYAPPSFCMKEKEKFDVEEWSVLGASKIYPENWKLIDTEILGNIYENKELLL